MAGTCMLSVFFFFKQKTAYEMRISDWSSDVCSSDLDPHTEAPTEMTKGEQRLAKLLEGRVAGEPKSCISNYPTSRMEVIDKTAYVFGDRKSTRLNSSH